MVTAFVVMALVSPRYKKVLNLETYFTLFGFAMGGFFWVYAVVELQSPGKITFPESLFFMTLFASLLLILYILDKRQQMKSP